MSQLKVERAKLDSDIKMKEELYNIHYSRFKESIKIRNIISSFITRFSIMIPLIVKTTKTFRNLYNFVLEQFRPGKKEQHYSQEQFNSETNDSSDVIDQD